MQSKERLLRAAKEKGQVTYKVRPIRITHEFSLETMKARKSRSNVMQTLRDHGCQSRLLFPAKLSITIEGQNKILHEKSKFHQYLATNPALHKMLEGKLQPKKVGYTNKNRDN